MNTRMPQKFALVNQELVLMEMGLEMPSRKFDDELPIVPYVRRCLKTWMSYRVIR